MTYPTEEQRRGSRSGDWDGAGKKVRLPEAARVMSGLYPQEHSSFICRKAAQKMERKALKEMAKRRVSYIKAWIEISGPEIWRGQDRQAKSPNAKGAGMRLDKATDRLFILIIFLLIFYYFIFLADSKHWLGQVREFNPEVSNRIAQRK